MFDRSRFILALAAVVAAALTAAALTAPRDLVLYNHSPSVPEGLYLRTGAPVTVGGFVTVRARDVAPEQAHQRSFEDAGDRFIKRVAAMGGARVCSDGRRLVVGSDGDGVGDDGDDRRAVAIRVVDVRADQSIHGWRGCRVLDAGEVLLLGDTEDSFDGRYWGPISTQLIEGVWRRF